MNFSTRTIVAAILAAALSACTYDIEGTKLTEIDLARKHCESEGKHFLIGESTVMRVGSDPVPFVKTTGYCLTPGRILVFNVSQLN
jgi:hypothetical protein